MDFISPLARQLIVASSPLLAGLSIGGVTGYPAVLINQLKENGSSLELNLDTQSWIASTPALAGISSIIIPTIMQWKGRRFAFIVACSSSLIGWILAFAATNVTTVLIGESFLGFGGNSLVAVSLITISEMIDPKFRSTLMMLFGFNQIMGIVLVTLAGYFLHWKTVSVVIGVPTLIALLLVSAWPESPSWLACKGEFKKCEEAFIILRGTSKDANKELEELIHAQKESLRQITLNRSVSESRFRDFRLRITRRDFYLPITHVILIMFTFFFSGPLVIFTYATNIIANTTNESDFTCFIFIDIVAIVSSILSVFFIKYFNNKSVMITSLAGSGFALTLSSIVLYCKDLEIFPKQSLLFCILGNIFFSVLGSSSLTFNLSAELIPVKHRGIGGTIYVTTSCLFHSVSLKVSPYVFDSIGMSGTFLCFAFVAFSGTILFWVFVPETKGRTLQEIEDYYNCGSFTSPRTRYEYTPVSLVIENKAVE